MGRPRRAGIARRPCPRRSSIRRTPGVPVDDTQAQAEAMSLEMVDLVRRVVVPRLLREARARGWWDPLAGRPGSDRCGRDDGSAASARRPRHGHRRRGRRGLVGRCRSPRGSSRRSTPTDGPRDRGGGPRPGRQRGRGGRRGSVVVGLAVTGPDDALLALGVAPGPSPRRPRRPPSCERRHARTADVTVAERDPVDPCRMRSARRSLAGSSRRPGSRVTSAPTDVRAWIRSPSPRRATDATDSARTRRSPGPPWAVCRGSPRGGPSTAGRVR